MGYALALAVLGAFAPAASADLTSLKATCEQRDAADGDTGNGVTLPFRVCDDGTPAVGGRTPNVGALSAVAVPQKYGGFAALPAKVAPDPNAGADPDGNIAIDAIVSLPDPATFPPPPGGYPLVVFMHGCCMGQKVDWTAPSIDAGGERWHYSNAWFASRGYAVLNYTARGFVDAQNKGSTGETQLDSRSYEVNDLQHLAGQLADDAFFNVDGTRVVATGGSYGGGLAWMTLTDPTWTSPGGKPMKLVAAAPKYGWTDLPYSLIPNGVQRHDRLPTTDPVAAMKPLGYTKTSIVSALFVSGQSGVPPGNPHTTFPPSITESFACLQSTDPYEANPLCASPLSKALPAFYVERSAYYQNHFFERIKTDAAARIPVFGAGTFSDPLFWTEEHRRMAMRLRSIVPGYPIEEHYGDYQHFVQNKAKEWGDVCGADRHVCRLSDYPGGDLNAAPAGRLKVGATSRLNRLVDFYAKPQGNPSGPSPTFDVTGSLQVCPDNATPESPGDEAGERFTAPTFEGLAPNTLTVDIRGQQATINKAAPNGHAANSDPIGNVASNASKCPVEQAPGGAATAGAGVATYDSTVLDRDVTMMGFTRVSVPHSGEGDGIQLNARLYDLLPEGKQVLVDRTTYRVTEPNGTSVFDLKANGWRFAKGHRIRIEIAQDDNPFVKNSNRPSALILSGVKLELPIRESSATVGGVASGTRPSAVDLTSPRFASDRSTDPRFGLRLRPDGEVDHYEIDVRNLRRTAFKRLTSNLRATRFSFAGYFGSGYEFRARAVREDGTKGAWDHSRTLVPLDDRRRRRVRFSRGWSHPRVRGAYAGSVSRALRGGAVASLRIRGRRVVYLIGRVGPGGGRALVQFDGRRRVVSFRARKARNRAVVGRIVGRKCKASAKRCARRVHVLRVTSRGGRVDLDGFGY